MQQKSLRKRLALATLWSLIGTATSQGSNVASAICVARILGQKSFGEFTMISSTFAALGVFAGIGLGMTTTKYVAELHLSNPRRVGIILGLCNQAIILFGGTFSLGLLLLSPQLADFVLNAPQLQNEVRLGCILMFLNAVIGIQTATLSGFESFNTIAKLNLVYGILNFIFTVSGAWYYGVIGAVAGMTSVSSIAYILNSTTLNFKYKQFGIKVDTANIYKEIKIFIEFSIPSFLSSVLVAPVMWIASTFIVHQSNGYAEIGAFNAANQLRGILLFFPLVLGQALLPILSSIIGNSNTKSTYNVLGTSICATAIVVLPVTAILIIGNKQIMQLYGSDFANYGSVLIVMSIAMCVAGIQTPIGNLVAASGKMWLGFMMNFGWAITFLSCSWLFIQQGLGAFGLALSYMIAYSIHTIWIILFTIRYLKQLQ